MSCVVVVAPIGTRWAHQAESALADHRVVVARLFDPSALGLLVHAGGVRAVALDDTLARAHPGALRARVRVVAIAAWSDAALRELLGGPR